LTPGLEYVRVAFTYFLDTLSRVVEGAALRSHSNRFHDWNGMQVLIPVPEKGEDKVRVNLFLSIGRGFFIGI